MNNNTAHKKNSIGSAVAVGAAMAAGIAVAKLLAGANKQAGAQARKPLELLLQTQYVTRVFTAREAKAWFLERTGGNTAGKTMVLARVSSEAAQRLDCQGMESLNPDEYLLQVILDGNEKVTEMRLVNFESMEDELRRLLDENSGAVHIEE